VRTRRDVLPRRGLETGGDDDASRQQLLLIKVSKWGHLINNSGMRLKNIGQVFARINLRHSGGTLAARIVADT
jgi:hypothetical protein